MRIMQVTITATRLARKLGDVLGRVRYRGDSFVIERNGEPIARLTGLPSRAASTLRDGLKAWKLGPAEVGDFAGNLDQVNRADRPPRNAWVS